MRENFLLIFGSYIFFLGFHYSRPLGLDRLELFHEKIKNFSSRVQRSIFEFGVISLAILAERFHLSRFIYWHSLYSQIMHIFATFSVWKGKRSTIPICVILL